MRQKEDKNASKDFPKTQGDSGLAYVRGKSQFPMRTNQGMHASYLFKISKFGFIWE